MPRVVLDSNVLISALHFGGVPEELLLMANQGAIEVFLSPFILDEVAGVLQDKLDWEPKDIRSALRLLKDVVTLLEPKEKPHPVTTDQADNLVLACAVEAHADFLVTGDKRHLLPLKRYKGIQILTPRDFLEKIILGE